MSEERRDRGQPRRQTLEETSTALDEMLVELEVVLRFARAELRAASQQAAPDVIRRAATDIERNIHAIAERLRRLSDSANPEPVRQAGRESEQIVEEASERLRRAAQSGAPDQIRQAAREADRLVRRAGGRLRQASRFTRPHLIRQAARIDMVLDRGQHHMFHILWFSVPPGSVIWDLHFQALVMSRLLTDMALQALLYGTLIAVVRRGGGALDAAFVGTAFLLPGALLGLYGGAVADAVSKRVALAGAYVAMALLCFAVPAVIGTGFKSLLMILFAVRTLHQVSQPSESSAVPLVADAEELASANSMMSLASSIGEVVGKAALAPLLVRQFGVEPVVTLAGVLFLLAFTRVFELTPAREAVARRAADHGLVTETGAAVRWLLKERRVLWMLLLGGLASTVGVVLGMLGPAYVAEVLHVDPTYTLYVFMPAAFGLGVALVATPRLLRVAGERVIAGVGFGIAAAAMVGFGYLEPLTARVFSVVMFEVPGIGRELQVAAALSMPLGFGITLAAAAAQTCVGRSVPPALQGRMFALLYTMKDGLAIVSLLALGAVASAVSARAVITAAPFVLLVLALAIDFIAGHFRSPESSAASAR